MRKSIALIAAITAPLLAVVACGPSHTEPPKKDTVIMGIVKEKEYEPAKTKQTCKKPKRRGGKRTCTTKVVKKECYELDIHVRITGEMVEICDEGAYKALDEGDPYSSAINYATVS